MKKNYLLKSLLIVLFLGIGMSNLFAQENTGSISGKIVDAKGEPMIGVLVMDETSQQGVQTDLEGNYKIANLKEGEHNVLVKFIGYSPVKKKVTVKAGESVALGSSTIEESAKQLKEVVVVGYGTSIKREVTGSISQISSKDLQNVQVPSFDAALQGRASGLQVTQSSGAAGAAVRVRIRGQASISGSGDPLYVIDGVPVTNGNFGDPSAGPSSAQGLNPLASINPADIESIEVLKDAGAGAIYGARAANGVILVTTKRGKAGKSEFNLSYNVGVSTPTHTIKLLDANQWADLYQEAYQNDNVSGKLAFPSNVGGVSTFTKASFANRQFTNGTPFANTNWYDEVLRTGKTQDINLSAKGGTEKTTYYLAGGYNDNTSMLNGNSFKRISGRINVDNKATDKLTIGTQVGIYYTENNQVPSSYLGGIGGAQSTALPIYPVLNADGSYFGTQLSVPATWFNPAAQLNDKFKTSVFRSLSNIYLSYKITPDLVFRAEGGLDYMDQVDNFFFSPINRYYQNKPLGAAQERRVNVVNLNTNNTLTYTKTFKEKHKITALAGFQVQGSNQNDIGFYPASGSVGFNDPYFTLATSNMQFSPLTPAAQQVGPTVAGFNNQNAYRFASYFSRINYVLLNKYIFQVSLRSDGSSRFGTNRRFGYFPAVSASWIITDENFMKDIPKISMLKLRTSYGLTGNSEIGNFAWLGTYNPNGNYLGQPGLAPNVIANPDLTWESTKQFDLGLDFGLFNDRITGTLGYYYKLGTNILLNRPVQPSATGLDRMTVNSHVVVQNYGLEFNITTRNIVSTENKLTWTTDFNISGNRNSVLDNDGIPKDGFETGPGDTRVLLGQPVGINLLAPYAGVNPSNGYEQIYDLSGNKVDLSPSTKPKVQQDNRVAMGNPFPKFIAGLGNTFTFKNFDLNFLFYCSYGNTIYDDGGKYQWGAKIGTWNQRADVLTRWQKPGDVTDVPKLTLNPFNPDYDNTSRFLYDASFIRLRTLSLGYKLPQRWVDKAKLKSLRVYVMGQNLMLFTRYPGMDPEVVRYAGNNNQANVAYSAPYLSTPQAKTITFGINIGF